MARISVLPREVAEKIAAGEVVERPASIVKELTENAIDAGAKSITVELKNGGTTFLRVTDNGCGIPYNDVPTAFLRHATSKISNENDLENIRTMGFRGEALASIAAVCRVEILTRTADETSGARYLIEGLEEKVYEPAGCPVGTTIVVRDIFYNTPARMKFLRKDVAEGNAVASIVDKLALANPDISFSLIRDGRETLFTPGDGKLISAINAVLGRQFTQGLIPVSYDHKGIHVEGYISRPEAARANRTMQHFFVNDRYVKYAPPFLAATDAYKHRIMVGKFPSCVLFLTVNPMFVDVNVHPAKTEVKFAAEKDVYDAVFFAVRSGLDAFFAPKQAVIPPVVQKVSPFVQEPAEQQVLQVETPTNTIEKTPEKTMVAQEVKPIILKSEPVKEEIKVPTYHASSKSVFTQHDFNTVSQSVPKLERKEPIAAEEKTVIVEKPTVIPTQKVEFKEEAVLPIKQEEQKSVKEETLQYKFIGEVFSTYLVVEFEDEVLLIDKHAAHERYLFNQLQTRAAADDRQILLSSIPVQLTKELYEALIENRDSLLKLGFLVDDFGEGFLMVREIPMYLPFTEVQVTIDEIAQGFARNKNSVTPSLLEDLLHNMACRAAIKGGDINRSAELEKIVEIVLKDKDVRYCPHGRPVAISLTRKQLEKQFGRLI